MGASNPVSKTWNLQHENREYCYVLKGSLPFNKVCYIQCAGRCLTMPHSASQCLTMPHNASQCLTMPHTASQCLTMPHNASQCLTVPHNASQCLTMPHNTSNVLCAPLTVNAVSMCSCRYSYVVLDLKTRGSLGTHLGSTKLQGDTASNDAVDFWKTSKW